MFLFILFIFFLRFMFWLCVAMLAIALGLLCGLVALTGQLIALRSPEAGAKWTRAAGSLWRQVESTAGLADAHKRWVLPNKRCR